MQGGLGQVLWSDDTPLGPIPDLSSQLQSPLSLISFPALSSQLKLPCHLCKARSLSPTCLRWRNSAPGCLCSFTCLLRISWPTLALLEPTFGNFPLLQAPACPRWGKRKLVVLGRNHFSSPAGSTWWPAVPSECPAPQPAAGAAWGALAQRGGPPQHSPSGSSQPLDLCGLKSFGSPPPSCTLLCARGELPLATSVSPFLGVTPSTLLMLGSIQLWTWHWLYHIFYLWANPRELSAPSLGPRFPCQAGVQWEEVMPTTAPAILHVGG